MWQPNVSIFVDVAYSNLQRQRTTTCDLQGGNSSTCLADSKHQAANDPSNVSMSSKATSNPHSKCLKYCLPTETSKKW
jgi:hypothetical protein